MRMYSNWYKGNMIVHPGLDGNAVEYFVDGTNGNDNWDGLSWTRAKATIQAALNLARYLPGTTTIDTTVNRLRYVYVAPGHYNERVAWSGYGIHLIGSGHGVPGKDYGVSLNYDGALTAGDAYICAFGGSGNSIRNLHVYCDVALPAVHILAGDNNLIKNVVIEGDGTNCTYGIHAQSMKGSVIKDVVMEGMTTAGIWVETDADVYMINGAMSNNQIYSDVNGCVGILVDNGVVTRNFKIDRNFIDLEGGDATNIGIDNNAASGNVCITDNYIVMENGATAAESASHGMLHNHVSVNGTVTDPFNDD